jgi:hypothetical protein
MAVKQVELPSEAPAPTSPVSGSNNARAGANFEADKIRDRRQAMVEALQREIQLLKEMEHANIVRYLGNCLEGLVEMK